MCVHLVVDPSDSCDTWGRSLQQQERALAQHLRPELEVLQLARQTVEREEFMMSQHPTARDSYYCRIIYS